MGVNLVLLGAPGAGKGTQAKFIAERFGFVHVSTGDLVRAEIASGSHLGLSIAATVKSGGFPADGVILDLFRGAVSSAAPGFILDGIPRTLPQVAAVDDIFRDLKTAIHGVIALDVPDEVIVQRLTGRFTCGSCGAIYNRYFYPLKDGVHCDQCGADSFVQRPDDQADTVARRLDKYHQETEPLLAVYRDRGLVASVDATAEADRVLKEISCIVEKLLESNGGALNLVKRGC